MSDHDTTLKPKEQPLGDELQQSVPGLDAGDVVPAEIPRIRERARDCSSHCGSCLSDIYRLCNTAATLFAQEQILRDLVRDAERFLYADLLSNDRMVRDTRMGLRATLLGARRVVSGIPPEGEHVHDLR